MEMIDITSKEAVRREAVAQGRIRLKAETVSAIKHGQVAKGDVLGVSKVSAVMAVKRTPELIPACHVVPVTKVKLDFDLGKDAIKATCTVTSVSKTGVEMEALTGVSVALLTIWDMTKELEKDARGQYPTTSIEDVRVLRKVKSS